MSSVWKEIETQTPFQEKDFKAMNLGDAVLKKSFCITSTDFTDVEAEEYAASEIDDSDPENPITIKKRTHKIVWKDLPGLSVGTETEIENKEIKVDIRQAVEFNAGSIVVTKPTSIAVTP